jgi:hypothetical protein
VTITVADIGTGTSLAQTGLSGITQVTVPAGGVPSNSFIIVGVSEDSTASAGSVTDTRGNSFHKKVSAANGGINSNGWGSVHIAWNSSQLFSGDIITYHKYTQNAGTAVTAFYATGIKTTADPTNLVVGPVNGTTDVSISGTPTNRDLVVAFCALAPNGVADIITKTPSYWTTPFTGILVPGGYTGVYGGHLISDGSTVTYSQHVNNSNRHQIGWMISFTSQAGAVAGSSASFAFSHPFPA